MGPLSDKISSDYGQAIRAIFGGDTKDAKEKTRTRRSEQSVIDEMAKSRSRSNWLSPDVPWSMLAPGGKDIGLSVADKPGGGPAFDQIPSPVPRLEQRPLYPGGDPAVQELYQETGTVDGNWLVRYLSTVDRGMDMIYDEFKKRNSVYLNMNPAQQELMDDMEYDLRKQFKLLRMMPGSPYFMPLGRSLEAEDPDSTANDFETDIEKIEADTRVDPPMKEYSQYLDSQFFEGMEGPPRLWSRDEWQGNLQTLYRILQHQEGVGPPPAPGSSGYEEGSWIDKNFLTNLPDAPGIPVDATYDPVSGDRNDWQKPQLPGAYKPREISAERMRFIADAHDIFSSNPNNVKGWIITKSTKGLNPIAKRYAAQTINRDLDSWMMNNTEVDPGDTFLDEKGLETTYAQAYHDGGTGINDLTPQIRAKMGRKLWEEWAGSKKFQWYGSKGYGSNKNIQGG